MVVVLMMMVQLMKVETVRNMVMSHGFMRYIYMLFLIKIIKFYEFIF